MHRSFLSSAGWPTTMACLPAQRHPPYTLLQHHLSQTGPAFFILVLPLTHFSFSFSGLVLWRAWPFIPATSCTDTFVLAALRYLTFPNIPACLPYLFLFVLIFFLILWCCGLNPKPVHTRQGVCHARPGLYHITVPSSASSCLSCSSASQAFTPAYLFYSLLSLKSQFKEADL